MPNSSFTIHNSQILPIHHSPYTTPKFSQFIIHDQHTQRPNSPKSSFMTSIHNSQIPSIHTNWIRLKHIEVKLLCNITNSRLEGLGLFCDRQGKMIVWFERNWEKKWKWKKILEPREIGDMNDPIAEAALISWVLFQVSSFIIIYTSFLQVNDFISWLFINL